MILTRLDISHNDWEWDSTRDWERHKLLTEAGSTPSSFPGPFPGKKGPGNEDDITQRIPVLVDGSPTAAVQIFGVSISI